MDQIESAKKFASDKFQEIGKENHFLDVFQILKDDFGVDDQKILVGALLHDILEDTQTTYEEIEKAFSKEVADLVQEVSHPPNYSQEQRVQYYKKIKTISDNAKLIKLADFASNLKSFIEIYKKNEQHLYPKFVNNDRYIASVRTFLSLCEDSIGTKILYDLTNKLEAIL